jgi:hypothetical protein
MTAKGPPLVPARTCLNYRCAVGMDFSADEDAGVDRRIAVAATASHLQ